MSRKNPAHFFIFIRGYKTMIGPESAGFDEVLTSRDKALRVAEEEIRKIVHTAAAAVIEDVYGMNLKDSRVTRIQIQGIVRTVFEDLQWVPEDSDIA